MDKRKLGIDYYCQIHLAMTGTIIVNVNTVPEFPFAIPILLVGII